MLTRVLAIFLVIMLGSGVPASAQEPARLALVIGNQSYDPSVGVLKNPHNDIALVGQALAKQGFTVLPPVKDAGRVQILGAVRDFVRRLNQAGPGAIGFLYYSGHGAADGETKLNYLIPVDARKPGTETFWDESVKLDDLLRLLGNASAAAKFVVFDGCRNELRLPYRGAKGFEPVREQPGIYVAYTTAPGQPASDDGDKSGPYAAALSAELLKPGLDHLSLFQNVKEVVYSSTKGAQQPWESNGLIRRVYLTGQPKPPVKGDDAKPPMSEAAQAWIAVQGTASEAVLEEFTRRFPDSVYAGFAKARLEELRRNSTAASTKPDDKPSGAWWPWSSNKPPEPDKPKDPQVAVVGPPKPSVVAPEPAEETCDGIFVAVALSREKPCIKPGSGQSFKDCPDCPEMVIVPSGKFTMGSPASEPQRYDDEGPQHQVTISKPFAVGKFAVTFSEWEACAAGGGCDGYKPDDRGWGRGDRPVINVNWNDAKAYVKWLGGKTGKTYRLLSEAEFEYAARAGTATPFWWGSSITPEQANYDGSADPYKGGGKNGEYRQKTLPVKSFKPNSWGLYQVHGNVWTWTEDCYADSYRDAPSNGLAKTTVSCGKRVFRGGSWDKFPLNLRAADRNGGTPDGRYGDIGFRVARTLNP